MTKEDFQAVFPPKIMTTKNLDILTRKFCKNLDYFVVCSSVASGLGNAGQSNYAYANSVMERICEERVKDGLPGLAVQWGSIGEVGFFAENFLKGKGSKIHNGGLMEDTLGIKPQSIASCLNILDQAMQLPYAVCSSMVIADRRDVESRFNLSLAERIRTIFGIDLDKISPSIKLTDLGMDSMILFELKQTLERDFDLPLTSNQLRLLTLGDIKSIEAGKFDAGTLGIKSQNVGPSDIGNIVLYEECLVELKLVDEGKTDGRTNAPLFFIHGVPGGAAVFKHLAENLNVSTYALQFGLHSDPETVAPMAAVYVEVSCNNFTP